MINLTDDTEYLSSNSGFTPARAVAITTLPIGTPMISVMSANVNVFIKIPQMVVVELVALVIQTLLY